MFSFNNDIRDQEDDLWVIDLKAAFESYKLS